jgi:hypothetical protein
MAPRSRRLFVYQLTVMRFNFTQLTATSIAIACFTTRQVEMCRRLLSGLAFLATSVDYYDIIGKLRREVRTNKDKRPLLALGIRDVAS